MKKQVNELSLERVRTLLGNLQLNEDQLLKMLERIKAFCKVSYKLYLKGIKPNKPPIERKLNESPPDKFTNAA